MRDWERLTSSRREGFWEGRLGSSESLLRIDYSPAPNRFAKGQPNRTGTQALTHGTHSSPGTWTHTHPKRERGSEGIRLADASGSYEGPRERDSGAYSMQPRSDLVQRGALEESINRTHPR